LGAVTGLPQAAAAESTVNLGRAASFAVLAATTVTSAGVSTIGGDIGVSPGTAITGFGPGIGTLTGTLEGGSPKAANAQTDLALAYADVIARPPATPVTALGDAGAGQTLGPGLYAHGSGLGLTGTLNLDAGGNPDAVFIFRAGSTLITAANSVVNLVNGAQACRVFWQVGSSATLGATSVLKGNLLVYTSVTVGAGVNVAGRILAEGGAVTLDNDVITVPGCSAPAPPGSLSISVPATRNLGSAAAGASSLSGSLGTVTVTDTRGASAANWTATVSATSFVTGDGTAAETIPMSALSYGAGTATKTGTSTLDPGGGRRDWGGRQQHRRLEPHDHGDPARPGVGRALYRGNHTLGLVISIAHSLGRWNCPGL
jgi:hypothetical protein